MSRPPSPPPASIALSSPFPAWVGFRQETVRDEAVSQLLPGEEQLLTSYTHPRRRLELASGRLAARRALMASGGAEAEILSGPAREPLWPSGFVGSITHKTGLALSAVAPRERTLGLGIDLENLSVAVSQGIADRVLTDSEQRWVDAAESPEDAARRLRMSFSAKESIFKALYPVEQVWFGYQEAELEWQLDLSSFRARLLSSVAADYQTGKVIEGRCLQSETWILTSVLLPR